MRFLESGESFMSHKALYIIIRGILLAVAVLVIVAIIRDVMAMPTTPYLYQDASYNSVMLENITEFILS